MQVEKLKTLVLECLENSKAQAIETLDVRKLTDITDYMIVCSGTSNRHTRSIAEHLVVQSKAHGAVPLAVEGLETGEWVLVDLIDIVIHIMLTESREFYSLEKLWSVSAVKRPAKLATKTAKKPLPQTPKASKKLAKPAVSSRKKSAKPAATLKKAPAKRTPKTTRSTD